jgi:hypothetical protein
MLDALSKVLLIAGIQLVIVAALKWTGAHPHSMRFGVVLKVSFFASFFYVFASNGFMTGSNFWFKGEWVDTPTPSLVWKFLAALLGIIATVCFFAIGNET